MEIWKTIIEATNYEISNTGFVRNKKTQQILKGRLSKNGYFQVSIKIDIENKFMNRYIHRLVAQYFLDNIENKREVNHKDGNKINNHFSNLEWVTSSENQKHRHLIGKTKTSQRKVGAFDLDGKLILQYDSIIDAFTSLNKPSRVNIDNALQGKQKTAYGYVWKYLD